MATVLLIRHGRTQANANGVLAGWSPGVFLDERGREQAAALAERLAPLALTALVSSPLDRTLETADILLRDRPAVPRHADERLGEAQYGDWTGRPLKELSKEPMWKVVQAHPSGAVFPGGESMAGMQHRAVACVRDWNDKLGDDAVYAVVSHGDIIKAIVADALGLHLDQFQRLRVDPCSVSVIEYTSTRPFVERMNDTGGSFAGFGHVKGRRPSARRRSGDAAVGGGAGR